MSQARLGIGMVTSVVVGEGGWCGESECTASTVANVPPILLDHDHTSKSPRNPIHEMTDLTFGGIWEMTRFKRPFP